MSRPSATFRSNVLPGHTAIGSAVADNDDEDWEARVAAAWASFDSYDEPAFLALMERLAAELPPGDPAGLFERASAFDAVGREAEAVPLYREALAHGLPAGRRRRAVIQLGSSLRNIGEPAEAAALLAAELGRQSDELDDAVRAFLALALADSGREREAVSVALTALAPHLPEYQRAVGSYVRLLLPSELSPIRGQGVRGYGGTAVPPQGVWGARSPPIGGSPGGALPPRGLAEQGHDAAGVMHGDWVRGGRRVPGDA
jgi:tetratricopeptide (TPR) repeat protein